MAELSIEQQEDQVFAILQRPDSRLATQSSIGEFDLTHPASLTEVRDEGLPDGELRIRLTCRGRDASGYAIPHGLRRHGAHPE
jgi:hypothetical protein